MDHNIERRYYVERIADFVRGLESQASDLRFIDENRVVFRAKGRPFETLAWIDEEHDLICITTRTSELPESKFDDAVKIMQLALQTCWNHCVAVSPADKHYELSMALFVGGFTFEAFEAVVFNLLACAESIELSFVDQKEAGKQDVGEG